jgi:isoquinoline 1-oxidoreductase subunit beta
MSTNKSDQHGAGDSAFEMDRREFLTTTAVVGGGMMLGFSLPATATAATIPVQPDPWYRDATVPEVNAWITISPDETVTIRIGQTEIGTGVLTCNAMIVAEELQCDWTKVRSQYASANRDFREKAPEWTLKVPGNGESDPGGAAPVELGPMTGVYRRMIIHSSGNIRESRYYLQLAGAEARERLLLAASQMWNVPVSELVAKDSVITHAKSRRRTTYGAIAARAAAVQLPDPASTVKIKTPDKFTLCGTQQKNLDIPLKVTGQAVYGIDIRLPGMLYAAAKACPVWGGEVKSFNADQVKGMPGVQSVVLIPYNDLTKSVDFLAGGVAVVADTWWHAQKALEALTIEWNEGIGAGVDSAIMFDRHVTAAKTTAGRKVTDDGNVDTGFAQAAKIVEATYSVPFSPRARMEPGNATVLVGDGRVDIWSGDQDPQGLLRNAVKLTGVGGENVHVHSTFQGGGYGSNGNGPQGEMAVFIANAVKGRPVKMLWTREEDWGSGTKYRPMSVCLLKAGLDGDGYPIAMEARHATTWNQGDMGVRGLSTPPYFMPNFRMSVHVPMSHVPIGTRRGTGAAPNAFYLESFIDELAHTAGKDPYLYRRELISRIPPGGKGVGGFPHRDNFLLALDMVAKQSNWGSPLPAGWARGIAIDDRRRPTRTTSTICAEVMTVEVTKAGKLRLHKADIVFERGFAFMHPLAVQKQIEGQITWAYDDAIYQGTTLKDGRAVERNFDLFPVSRMIEYPREVNIQYFPSKRWITGAGEEAITQLPPAILNAVFKVTGKRLRSIPLKNHDLSWS